MKKITFLIMLIFIIAFPLELGSYWCNYTRCIYVWHYPCEVYQSTCVPSAYRLDCFYYAVHITCYDLDGNEYWLTDCVDYWCETFFPI